MALIRQQSVHTYVSSSGGVSYYFDVIVDAQGVVSVRNIRTPTSSLCDGYTSLPQTVTDDIKAATELVSLLQQETEVEAGHVVFTGQATQDVVIPNGVLNNTNYRVVFTAPDATLLEATAKTITGFTATAATIYGTVVDPKTVAYSVLVKAGGTSDLSGIVTVTNADGGSKAVVFASPLPTAAYRVVLEPHGFFDAYVPSATKLKTGFIIKLGHVPAVGNDAEVGYDLFA